MNLQRDINFSYPVNKVDNPTSNTFLEHVTINDFVFRVLKKLGKNGQCVLQESEIINLTEKHFIGK